MSTVTIKPVIKTNSEYHELNDINENLITDWQLTLLTTLLT